MVDTNDQNISSSKRGGLLWSKFVEAQSKRRYKVKNKQRMFRKNGRQIRPRRPLGKRRRSLEGLRRSKNLVERKVRALKDLIPNSSEAMGLEGLFRETTDYILNLRMRVKLMQIMVKVLTPDSDK